MCVENEDIVELIKSNVKLKIIIERLTNMSCGQSKMYEMYVLSCLLKVLKNSLTFKINFHRSGMKS